MLMLLLKASALKKKNLKVKNMFVILSKSCDMILLLFAGVN